MNYCSIILCFARYIAHTLLLLLIAIRNVQPQIVAFANDTDSSNTMNAARGHGTLSSLDKIIISTSCGIFMGLICLFLWNLCEIRRYIAKQHRQLLRNNTSGSFPQHVPYDLNDVESTTSDNEDGAIGHYMITSAVTSSSSSNENATPAKRKTDDTNIVEVQSPAQNGNFGSPQMDSSGFPFLYADSPDFNAVNAASNANNILQPVVHEPVELNEVQQDGVDSFDAFNTSFNDSAFLNNDLGHQCEDTVICADAVTAGEPSDTISQNDEELSIPSATTAFDVLSVGNISLEQSMASSVMR